VVDFVEEFFTPAGGQTVFTIADTPVTDTVLFYVNGVLYELDVDYTVAGTTITWLDAKFTLAASDRVFISYFKASPGVLLTISRWYLVATSKYTAAPASTSQLTMSDTSDMRIGGPLRYDIGGTTYYGVITALVANTSITIAGAPLSGAVSNLKVSPMDVIEVDFFISGTYGASVQNLLQPVMKQYYLWRFSEARLVKFSMVHNTADTGANQPKLNVKVNANAVSTNDGNNGVQLSAAGTWVDNSAVAIDTTNYITTNGLAVEVALTVVGTNKDSSDLTVSCVFVVI
jgi:hypothetical protein